MTTERKLYFPILPLLLFCMVCFVAALAASSFGDSHPDAAFNAVGIISMVFFVGIIAFQVRAGWLRQKDAPKSFQRLCIWLIIGASIFGGVWTAMGVMDIEPSYATPLSFLSIWGAFMAAGTFGGLLCIMKERAKG